MSQCQQHAAQQEREQHTPEPWRIGTPPPNGEQTIGDSQGLMVAVATTGHDVDSLSNARRIVACVNACAGISTENLEDNLPVKELACRYNEIIKQRDELLAALPKWIDPNDKSQERYLPSIGEPVLFCHNGKTYLGKHTGGCFKSMTPPFAIYGTWDCHWMYPPPAIASVKEKA